MYTLFVILIVIAAILMIGIVLIQESKVAVCHPVSPLTTRLVVSARLPTS